MLDKFKGRSLSSITEQEVVELPEEAQHQLIKWMVQVELNYMVAEGMIDVETNALGEQIYTQNKHWNFNI